MKFHKNIILTAVLVAIVSSILLLIRECAIKGTDATPKISSKKIRQQSTAFSYTDVSHEALLTRMFSYNHPISLYGKVEDQYGAPVSGAIVEISLYPVGIPNAKGPDGGLRTDNEGRFSITGLTGSSIGALAMKKGYLRVPPLGSFSSSASLSYTGGDGSGERHAIPSNPVVLKLLKVGAVIPMIHVTKKRWKLPLNEIPKIIALDSEDGQGIHQIEFRFSSNWNKLPMDNEINSKQFDWSFEIRIPGGGFVWDESDVKFEAPESGYMPMVRYEYLEGDSGNDWVRFRDGRYFVKFADNSYGRIQFSIDGGSDRKPLYMESWLSLTPDSRNLATENMIIKVMEIKEP